MRRVLGPMLIALLAVAMLAAPATADEGAAEPRTILAVEGEPVGPEPMDRLDEDNPARELAGFEDPDVPFTYGAAYLLSFAGLTGAVLLGGLYWLLVARPARKSDGAS